MRSVRVGFLCAFEGCAAVDLEVDAAQSLVRRTPLLFGVQAADELFGKDRITVRFKVLHPVRLSPDPRADRNVGHAPTTRMELLVADRWERVSCWIGAIQINAAQMVRLFRPRRGLRGKAPLWAIVLQSHFSFLRRARPPPDVHSVPGTNSRWRRTGGIGMLRHVSPSHSWGSCRLSK